MLLFISYSSRYFSNGLDRHTVEAEVIVDGSFVSLYPLKRRGHEAVREYLG